MYRKCLVVLIVSVLSIYYNCDNLTISSNPPNCKIINLNDNAEIELKDTINIEVNASDEDGFVEEVRFYIDGIGKYSLSSEPFVYEWKTTISDTGYHKIKVIVEDNDNEESSDKININILLIKGEVFFSTDIQPLFNNNCNVCHGDYLPSANLCLENYDSLMIGNSNNGPVIEPSKKPRENILYQKVAFNPPPYGLRMPMDGPPFLDEQELKYIWNWIDDGAKNN